MGIALTSGSAGTLIAMFGGRSGGAACRGGLQLIGGSSVGEGDCLYIFDTGAEGAHLLAVACGGESVSTECRECAAYRGSWLANSS